MAQAIVIRFVILPSIALGALFDAAICYHVVRSEAPSALICVSGETGDQLCHKLIRR